MFGGFQLYRGSPLLGIISRWNWVQKDPKASVMNQWITLSKWSGWSFSLLNEEQTRWLLSTNQFIYNVFTQDGCVIVACSIHCSAAVVVAVARRSNFDVTESELESLGAPRSERPGEHGQFGRTRPEQQGGTLKDFVLLFLLLFEEDGPILTKILQCKWFEAIK